MKNTKVSLGGENSRRRTSGTRSSRVLSTIFKKLQKLDREISRLQEQVISTGAFRFDFGKHRNKKLEEQIKKLDLKRKEVRLERKKYYGRN